MGRASIPTSSSCDLNEWDAFSLEAALQLRESNGDGEVVVVTVGDEEAEEALLGCLARGADRAVRVWDDVARRRRSAGRGTRAVRGRRARGSRISCCAACSPPTRSTAPPGSRSPATSRCPTWPWSSSSTTTPPAATATVKRELEGGLVEVLRVRTPALLTIQTGINEPRYANLRAIKQAREKPLDVSTPDELGMDSDAIGGRPPVRRRRELRTPDRGEGAEMIDGSPAEVAARIVEIVRDRMALMSGVLVVAETRRGELREVSLELIERRAVGQGRGGRSPRGGGDRPRSAEPRGGRCRPMASTRCCW